MCKIYNDGHDLYISHFKVRYDTMVGSVCVGLKEEHFLTVYKSVCMYDVCKNVCECTEEKHYIHMDCAQQ